MKISRVFFLLLIVLMFSCAEKTQVNLIKGQFFQDCSTPLKFAEIALKANAGKNFADPIILGSAITGDNGYFELSYELEEEDQGNGDLIFVTSQGFETLITDVELNEDHIYTLYRNNISEITVSLSGSRNFGAEDTLFYGLDINGSEEFIVQPVNGVLDTFYVLVPNLDNGTTKSNLYYGIGKNDFQLSKEALSGDSPYQNIVKELEGCSEKETITIDIN